MGLKSTAVLNWPLTTFAQGYMQDRLAAYRLANLLMPIVQVGAASGTFKKFDDRNAFLDIDTHRGVGGVAKRLKFEATDDTYNCEPHALEIGEDDFEMALTGSQAAGITNELNSQGKIKSLLSRKATAYAKRAVTTAFAALTPIAGRGNFSNADIDPIDQIDEQLEAIATDVGSTENITMITSLSVWRAIRSNPKVKQRLGIAKNAEISLTKEQFLQGLLYPVNFEVSAVSATATKFGQTTVTKSLIVGSYVIILLTLPNPTIYDPSAFKCFSTSSALVDAVRDYREEASRSDIHAVDWSESMKQTSTLSARLLAVT